VIRHLSTLLLLCLAGAGVSVCGCGGAHSTTSTVSLGSSGAPAPAAAGSAAGARGNSAPAAGRESTSAASHSTTATAPGPVWNAVQCEAGLRAVIRSKGATSPAQLRAYKQTLGSQHGCFTSASGNRHPAGSQTPLYSVK